MVNPDMNLYKLFFPDIGILFINYKYAQIYIFFSDYIATADGPHQCPQATVDTNIFFRSSNVSIGSSLLHFCPFKSNVLKACPAQYAYIFLYIFQLSDAPPYHNMCILRPCSVQGVIVRFMWSSSPILQERVDAGLQQHSISRGEFKTI